MSRRAVSVVFLIVGGVTLPFLNKPFHIDDTFVLKVSEQCLRDPFDPFAGEIDWTGDLEKVFDVTTNPPFLSYYFAPFAALSDFSEAVLHLAIVPFYLGIGLSTLWLGRRFGDRGLLPVVCILTSPAVLVSGNVMRDVPAAALGITGLALFIWGVDEERSGGLWWGALLIGLSILTKYSAAVMIPVIGLYALIRGQYRALYWIAIPVTLLGLWSLHNWVYYGMPHIVHLLERTESQAAISWQDKLAGAILIIGSSIYLAPVLLWGHLKEGHRARSCVAALSALLAGAVSWYWLDMPDDPELWLWAGAGGLLIVLTLPGPADLRRRLPPDELFLTAWFFAPFAFSVLFVPFQAVRHLILALPPLVLLAGYRLRHSWNTGSRGAKGFLAGLILTQATVAVALNLADYEYASAYRSFAASVKQDLKEDRVALWYVGHWGWKFYADRQGFRQLHQSGPFPAEGDLLIWPQKVHIGRVFSNDSGLRDRLEEVASQTFRGTVPLRTQDRAVRAGFYATIRGRLPYRFTGGEPLETFKVLRVGPLE